MKRRLLLTLLPLTVLLFFAAFAVTPVKGEGTGASVWTDKPNYTLGKTVTISGSGFSANTQVTISIETLGEEIDERSAITNDAGDFTYQYQLGGIAGTYTVTATDGKQTAPTASFTVSEPFYISIDRINGNSPPFPSLTSPIHLEGSASALDFPGELSDYSVQVDWGDGTKTTDTSDVKFVQSGQDFSGTWSSLPDHEYATSGLWRIQVKLYHGTPPGSGPGDAEASAWAQVEVGVIRIGIMINTTTSPTCLNLLVDGANYTAPWTFEWIVGSTHSIGATSPQLVSAGMRYSWTRWSDNGAIIHDIVVPSTSTTYTAYFTAQYYLSVESSPGTSSGTGWYDNTSTVYASLTDGSVSGGTGIRYVFTGWSGDASGTDLISGPIILDGPKTATANWKTQYLVSFDQTGSAGTPIINYGIDTGSTTAGAVPFDVWVDSGQQISYDYEAIVSGDPGVRHPLIGVSPASPQTVTGPLTIVGTYKTQFKVTFDQTGIGTDFTGTVVTIDSVDYVLTIPLAEFWWDKGSAHNFAFRSPLVVDPSVKQYVLVNGNCVSPLVIMESMTVAVTYKTQYCLTLATSPFVSAILAGAGWYDDNTYADISTTKYVDIAAGSSRYRFNGWTTGDISEIGDSSSTSTTVKMDKAKIVTANYIEQYRLTIATEPTAVGVSHITASPSSGDGFYDLNTEVRLKAETPIAIDGNSQWRFDHWSQGASGNSPSTSVIMDNGKSVTANHVKQFKVKFDQTGVGSDYSGIIVTFDETYYGLSELPQSFWLDEGDYSFEFHTPLEISDEKQKQYRWEETSGLTGARSGTLSISHSGHLIGNYKTQYYLALDANPSGVTTPNGAGWYDTGTYALVSTAQYVNIGADPSSYYRFSGWTTGDMTEIADPSATSTTVLMDKAKTVTANYEIQYLIQYYLALETSPLGIYSPSGSGWYYEGNRAIISTAEYIDIIPGFSRYRFVRWTTTGITEVDDPFDNTTTVLMDKTKTVTANYVVQYAITFDQTGLSSSATGAVLIIDSTTETFADLPYTEWVDSGNTITYAYSNPVTSSILDEQFWLKSVSGLSSPFIVDKACTIIGKYLALPRSVITDSCLCYFDEDEQAIGQQFTLIFVQISANTHMLVVSNPWQVYYNVFYVGKPGDLVDLTVTIPYPFVTRGSVPVNVYSYVSIDRYGRFRPSGRVTSEFAITGPSTTPCGAAGISLGDYTGGFESTVNIEVTGVVPSSGLVYVMVSLDYGLEWTWGYGVDSDGNAIGFGTNDLFIENGQSYVFSYTVDETYTQIIESENVFIRFPWLIRIFADS